MQPSRSGGVQGVSASGSIRLGGPQSGSRTKMKVTIGALAPTKETLASLTWREPAGPMPVARARYGQRPRMRPVPRLPPKVLSGSSPVELDMPVLDEIECGAFLAEGFETVGHRGRETVGDPGHVDVLRSEAERSQVSFAGCCSRSIGDNIGDGRSSPWRDHGGGAARTRGAARRGTRFDCTALTSSMAALCRSLDASRR
jgi:hypothetical protein